MNTFMRGVVAKHCVGLLGLAGCFLFVETRVWADETPSIAKEPSETSSTNATESIPTAAPSTTQAEPVKAAPTPTYLHLPPIFGVAALERLVEKRQWYGWQTMYPVAAVDLVLGLGIVSKTNGLIVTGYGLFLPVHILVGPIVHIANKRLGMAAVSLGLRGLVPLAGGYVVTKLVPRRGFDSFTPGYGIWGVAGGLVLADIIDISLLSYKTTKVPIEAEPAKVSSMSFQWALVPQFQAKQAGISVIGQW